MADVFSSAKRSAIMGLVRSSGNKGTELRLIRIFRASWIIGWRRDSKLPGKPDFVFPKLKVAVFVDGCFWHGCLQHGTRPKTRAGYWLAKLTGNKVRDRKVNRLLRTKGWTVMRIWEHELAKKNLPQLMKRLAPLAKIKRLKATRPATSVKDRRACL